jgi:hypothetical protein
MKEKKLEQVLEEALSAYIDDGRTVEDILREHAAYRGRLEPLLETAIATFEAFQAEHPSVASREHGLTRFLSDALARQRLRAIVGDG